MGKLHVILKKEDIKEQMQLERKIVVVFDVLLATSTISTLLAHGAEKVIPVINEKEARERYDREKDSEFLLVGERGGKTIDGFFDPDPVLLKDKVKGKTVILSTTNGTVAIKKGNKAKKLYIGSLLNSKAVVSRILESYQDETILLIASGAGGSFNVEDFYGTGHFLYSLLCQSSKEWDLTDSAYVAYQFFKKKKDESRQVLMNGAIGKMLIADGFAETIDFAAKQDIYDTVPLLKGDSIV